MGTNNRCYGHVYDDAPSLSVALYREYRGRGTGTALVRAMLETLAANNIKHVSLSVQKDNFACKIYRGLGFYTVEENEEECIMVCETIKTDN